MRGDGDSQPLRGNKLLSITDIQEVCNLSRSKAYRLLDEGLCYVRLGGVIRVWESDLVEFLRHRQESHEDRKKESSDELI